MATNGSESRTTVTWGGALLSVAGLITLLASARLVIPLGTQLQLPIFSAIPLTLAALLLAIATCVFAFGLGREPDFVNRSVLGRVCLLLYGLGWLLFMVFVNILDARLNGAAGAIITGDLLEVVSAIASLIAAIIVARAGVLRGFARWVLLVVAVCNVVFCAANALPLTATNPDLIVWLLGVVAPVSLLVCGITYVVYGRGRELSGRARSTNEAWRRTTDV